MNGHGPYAICVEIPVRASFMLPTAYSRAQPLTGDSHQSKMRKEISTKAGEGQTF